MAVTLYEYQTSANHTTTLNDDTKYIYASFTPTTTHSFNSVILKLYRVGTCGLSVTIKGCDTAHKPTGDALATGSLASGDIDDTPSTTGTEHTVTLSTNLNVAALGEFAIICHSSGADAENYINLCADIGE